MLGYAEELCFAPKYVRLKQLVDEGRFGKVHLVKQSEKHDGPHAGWFFDTRRSGGGVTFDMGCHADRVLPLDAGRAVAGGKARIASVYAQMGTYVHGDKTDGDDEAILLLDFEGGAVGLAEESWTKPGGMDDRAEVFGSDGPGLRRPPSRQRAAGLFSARGYGYAVEKAGSTAGWSFPIYEEIWNYGFPQEMEHFVSCVRDGTTPTRERPRRPRRRRGDLCPLRVGRQRPAASTSVRQRRRAADRSLALRRRPVIAYTNASVARNHGI